MNYSKSNKLFKNKYRYKIILQLFSPYKSGIISNADSLRYIPKSHIATDKKYINKIFSILKNDDDFNLHVTYYNFSIYSNTKKTIIDIYNVNDQKVQYVGIVENENVAPNTIYMPKIFFDYKITLRKTSDEHISFLNWAKNNKNVRMPFNCVRQLSSTRYHYGGSYFYIKGENNLLLAKMHLGESIGRIDRIVNT